METQTQNGRFYVYAFVPKRKIVTNYEGMVQPEPRNTRLGVRFDPDNCEDFALHATHEDYADAAADKTTQEYCYGAEGIYFSIQTKELNPTCDFETLITKYMP